MQKARESSRRMPGIPEQFRPYVDQQAWHRPYNPTAHSGFASRNEPFAGADIRVRVFLRRALPLSSSSAG
ncbi:hypothetical protein [Olivibacter sp. SDN3]|uniref:hypothetical protein n=1 Tax=Olivibacter sp. SDN3 TaxID=2764720 RepID=UPI001C9E27FE|nr:hypothetical protein [Olivibacter sp. SDN3]